MAGLYFEEFSEGQVFEHALTRTVTEMDNTLFCALTMNTQPLHLNEDFASKTQFGQRIVNGMQDILRLFLTRILSMALLIVSSLVVSEFPLALRNGSIVTLFSVGIPAVLLAGATMAVPAAAQDYCTWARDVRLVNGKIHTMDAQNRVVSQVTIQDGRVAFVGAAGNHKLDPCTKVIDLHGRTVVPGLIDNHNHFILFSMRPGHEIELEVATTIPQAMALLKHRAETTSAGGWVTTVGDWLPRQFAENRDPTLAEIDQAVPDHPVLLVPAFGPDVTNSLGKKFFESKGIAVSPTGIIAPGDPTWKALAALRSSLINHLQDEQGLTEEAAAWAVDSWRLALGLPGLEAVPPEPPLAGEGFLRRARREF